MELKFFVSIILFILGCVIGSFLNVCIYRIPRGESVVYPPSHCTNCNYRIKWYDLIPVLSWIILRGKCRGCNEKISIRYPLVEFFTGLNFLLVFFKWGFTLETLKFIILCIFLIVIGFIDYDTTDVYTFTTWSGIIVGIIFVIINYFYSGEVTTFIYGALLGGGSITLIILLTGGMGWGDAEICALSGIFLGFSHTIFMLFSSFLFGGLIGAILILTGKKDKKEIIPFGPFISLATIFTILFGNKIVGWYISMF